MGSRLRIVSICRALPNPDDPAAGIYVLNRLAAISRHADVHVIQPVPFFPAIRPLPDWAHVGTRLVGDVHIQSCPMPYVPGLLKSLDGRWLASAIAAEVRRLHAERPVDLIDAHFGYPEGVGCVHVGNRLRIPVFITMRGLENEYLRKPLIGHQLARALSSARGCVAVSHSLRDLAVEAGVDGGRIKVIQNAVDNAVFKPGCREQARRALGLPLHRRLVVSVGNLILRKRHHVLLDAFERIGRKTSEIDLAIIGGDSLESDYPTRIRARITELGLQKSVRLVGNISPLEVSNWLQAADVFALATAREGCCNAVLEALAVGLPVVTTPVGDNPHFIRDGHNGFLVPVDDPDALAGALMRAVFDRNWERKEIAQGLQVGQWDRVAYEVVDFFRDRLNVNARQIHPSLVVGPPGSEEERRNEEGR